MKSFKENGPSYDWEHSKGESVSELLDIDIYRLYDGGFQFYQNGLIRNSLESTGMDHCNGLSTYTKVEEPIGTYDNGFEANRYWPN